MLSVWWGAVEAYLECKKYDSDQSYPAVNAVEIRYAFGWMWVEDSLESNDREEETQDHQDPMDSLQGQLRKCVEYTVDQHGYKVSNTQTVTQMVRPSSFSEAINYLPLRTTTAQALMDKCYAPQPIVIAVSTQQDA